MIYFVDDDINQMKPFRDELEFLGFKVCSFRHADEALAGIRQANDIELIIMDVMIGTALENSVFSMEETFDCLITGLILIEKLHNECQKKVKNRIVLFSMASQSFVINEIEKREKKYITFLRKPDFADPTEFGEKIASIINSLP